MGSINRQKVIVGGLVAGIVLAVLDSVAYMYVLGPWLEGMPTAMSPVLLAVANGKRAMIGYPLSDLLFGFTIVWLYAAIRPRYGAGPKTAMCAGFAVWFVAAIAYGSQWLSHLESLTAVCVMSIAALIEVMIASWLGCRMYTEGGAA